MSEPAKKLPRPVPEVPTPRELAAQKLGPQEGIIVLEENTRALAEWYLDKCGIKDVTPDTQTTAHYLAIVRRNEHLLLTKMEEDLHRIILDGEAEDAGDALLLVTMNGRHASLNRELRRLHVLASGLLAELEEAGRQT